MHLIHSLRVLGWASLHFDILSYYSGSELVWFGESSILEAAQVIVFSYMYFRNSEHIRLLSNFITFLTTALLAPECSTKIFHRTSISTLINNN